MDPSRFFSAFQAFHVTFSQKISLLIQVYQKVPGERANCLHQLIGAQTRNPVAFFCENPRGIVLPAELEETAEGFLLPRTQLIEIIATVRRQLVGINENLDSARALTLSTNVAGAFHNCGALLMSMRTDFERLSNILDESRAENLIAAIHLLPDDKVYWPSFLTSHPKGKLLPAYFLKASRALAVEHQGFTMILDAIHKRLPILAEYLKSIAGVPTNPLKIAG